VRLLRRNLLMVYGVYAASIVSGLVTIPIVVHSLGKTQYGLWAFALGVTEYLNLLDLGVSPSVVRFGARSRGAKDPEQLNALASTGLAVYGVIGLLTVGAGLALSFAVPLLIDVPSSLTADARLATFLLVLSIAIQFPLGLFGDLLVAQQRYDVANAAGMLSVALYVGLIVALVTRTGGVVLVAGIVLATTALRLLVPLLWLRRELPFLRISRRYVNRQRFRELLRFSGDNFLIHVAAKVVYSTDVVVVGIVLGARAAALYAIASRIFSMATSLGTGGTRMLAPAFAEFEGAADLVRLRVYLRSGLRIGMAMMLALALPMILIPDRLIRAWIGPGCRPTTWTTLVLGFVLLVEVPLGVVMQYLIARGRQRRMTRFLVFSVVANIALSVLLARSLGVWGVALATLIVESALLILVPFVAFDDEEGSRRSLALAWLRPVVPAGLAGIVVLGGLGRAFAPTDLAELLPIGIAWGVVWGLVTWRFGLDANERDAIARRLRRRSEQTAWRLEADA